jgi:hypothetical protein
MTGQAVVITRSVDRDSIADKGRLAVIGVPPGLPQGQAPLWGLQAEEDAPLGPVVDVVGGLGAQVVCGTAGGL